MTQELKDALKVINTQLKETTYKEYHDKISNQSLSKRIEHLKGQFLGWVDHTTINYKKTQLYKSSNDPLEEYDRYTPTELSKREIENSIQSLEWFKQDIEACISHLKK